MNTLQIVSVVVWMLTLLGSLIYYVYREFRFDDDYESEIESLKALLFMCTAAIMLTMLLR